MRRIALVFLVMLSHCVWAQRELWVIYHMGCAGCENFLHNVIPHYPDPEWQKDHPVVVIKLLNAAYAPDQDIIATIKPLVLSTPTFVYVDKRQDGLDVLDRWVGYKDNTAFYQQLSQVIKEHPLKTPPSQKP